MSAARKAAKRAPAKKKAGPGQTYRELAMLAGSGELPRLCVLAGPTRGEEDPWFGEQVLAAARRWARQRDDLDLLEVDGGAPDFDAASVESFLGAPGLFGGERVLLLARAAKALKKSKSLANTLAQAATAADGPSLIVVEVPGSGLTQALKPLTAVKEARVERFRKLYTDPPPWRPHDLDSSEAAQFIQAEAAQRGLRFEPGAAGALVQFVGGRPSELLQSLQHFELLGLQRVGEDDIRAVAAQSAEGSAFDFADALIEGDGRRAYRTLAQLRGRGLRTWDGKRLAARDALAMMLAVASKQRMQTAAVRAGLDSGQDFAAACKAAGVAAGGPPAQRMKARLQGFDQTHGNRVLGALAEAERNLKVEGWSRAVTILELMAFRCHRARRRT